MTPGRAVPAHPEGPPESRSGAFAGAGGTRLHHLWWPHPRPRAALLLVHGLGEHAGRYAALARDLVPRGFAVHAFDLRGHGRSGGARGHAPRFGALLDDVEHFLSRAAAELPPGVPLFLLGHSLGGLVALRRLQARGAAPFRGAVLSAPLLRVALRAPRWKLALSGALSRWLGRLPVPSGVKPEHLTHDAAYIRSYREDPLTHARLTPRLFTEFTAAAGAARAHPGPLGLPALFLVPGADPVVDAAATLSFARGLGGEVEVREYPGFLHEPLNEVERARVVEDVVGWVEARLR